MRLSQPSRALAMETRESPCAIRVARIRREFGPWHVPLWVMTTGEVGDRIRHAQRAECGVLLKGREEKMRERGERKGAKGRECERQCERGRNQHLQKNGGEEGERRDVGRACLLKGPLCCLVFYLDWVLFFVSFLNL